MILTQSVDSARVAAEALLSASADSLLRVSREAIHAAADSALVMALDASGTNATWVGVFVAALGVLFAVGAVVAALMLWRQSSEFSKQREALFADAREEFDALLKDRNRAFEEWWGSVERRADALLEQQDTGEGALVVGDDPAVSLRELRAEIAQLHALMESSVLQRPRSFHDRAR